MVRAPLRPSRLLATVLVLAHAAAVATVFPLQIPLEWKAALLVAIATSLVRSLRRDALLRSPHAIVELEVSNRERASMRTRSGEWRSARILGTSCVTSVLTTLNLRVEGFRTTRHVLLVGDNVDPEDFRKIRVLLRWARADERDAEDPPRAYDA